MKSVKMNLHPAEEAQKTENDKTTRRYDESHAAIYIVADAGNGG